MTAECPTCGDEFDGTENFSSKSQMRIHHAQSHGESLVEVETNTCEWCSDEFEPTSNSKGKYCSQDCYGKAHSERLILSCETCGDQFPVSPSGSDRKFCSPECYMDSLDRVETRECPQCGRAFTPKQHEGQKHCHRSCFMEARLDRPRPDDPDMLVWLLYVYEGFDFEETYRRQRAVLGNDNRLYKEDVRDRLKEMGVYDPRKSTRRTLEEMDPDEFGASTPEGDDKWKSLYREESHAD